MIRDLKTKILVLALLGVFASLSVSQAFGAVAESAKSPMGYKDWKANRILEAKNALEKLQLQLDPNLSKAQANLPKSQKRDTRLSQAQTNLEIAQELGAHDYFVLYLSQLRSDTEIQEAVKKLDPSEVAEIMIGIKHQLSTEGTDVVTPPVVTPTPGMRTSRNP